MDEDGNRSVIAIGSRGGSNGSSNDPNTSNPFTNIRARVIVEGSPSAGWNDCTFDLYTTNEAGDRIPFTGAGGFDWGRSRQPNGSFMVLHSCDPTYPSRS